MTTETDEERDLRWAIDALKEISRITESMMRGTGRKIHEHVQSNLVLIDLSKNQPEMNLRRALRVLTEIRDMTDPTAGGINKPVRFQADNAITHIAIAQAARQAGNK